METFDFVIIGAGPAGEAAAFKARERGATVAIVDRRWFGGSCPHIGCLPSKSLLHSAAEHAANPPRYSWPRASARRDYMINRPAGAAEPDDASPRQAPRGRRRDVLPRDRPDRRSRPRRGPPRRPGPRARTPATSSSRSARFSKVPPIPGLEAIEPWTNREATLARELPKSLLVLGGGPTGCELAQVYVRFGVPTTIVQSGDRLDADRPSPQLRGGRRRCSGATASTSGSACGPWRPGPAAGHGRRPRDRPRRRHDRRGPRDPRSPSGGRSRSTTSASSTTASTRAGRDRVPARRPAPDRRRAVGRSATRPVPSCTPTRPTTRARWRSGWRSATTSRPTTGPCPGRPTPTPRRRSSG